MADGFDQPTDEAEQAEVERFMRRGAQVGLEPLERIVADVAVEVVAGQPATVRLPVDVQQLVAQLAEEAVVGSVVLEVAAPAAATTTAVLVFANQPDPRVEGAGQDPGYLGSIGFFCHGDEPDATSVRCELPAVETLRYRVPVRSRVAEAGGDGGELSITFLAADVALERRDVPPIEIRATSLELARSTVVEPG